MFLWNFLFLDLCLLHRTSTSLLFLRKLNFIFLLVRKYSHLVLNALESLETSHGQSLKNKDSLLAQRSKGHRYGVLEWFLCIFLAPWAHPPKLKRYYLPLLKYNGNRAERDNFWKWNIWQAASLNLKSSSHTYHCSCESKNRKLPQVLFSMYIQLILSHSSYVV